MANALLDFLTLDILEPASGVFCLPLHAPLLQKPGISACRVRYLASHHDSPHALYDLFFCENCLSVLSSDPIDIVEEVESYYCPQTLENLPSSEAVALRYKSARIFSCPECFSTLTIVADETVSDNQEAEGDKLYFFRCSHCKWDSKQCQLTGATASALIEMGIQQDKERYNNNVMQRLIERYTTLSEQDHTISSAPEDKDVLLIHLQGPWRWEHVEEKRIRNQTAAFHIAEHETLGALPESEQAPCPTEERTTLAQRLHMPMTQPMRRSDLRPQRVPLRTKRSIRCRRCLDTGAPNILIKAQINPLKGDSSVRMNVGSWFKKKSLAFDHLPRIIALRTDEADELSLIVTNQLEYPVELTLTSERSKDSFSVRVNEYDELAEIDFQLDKRVQLDRDASEGDHVLGRWRNKAILTVPIDGTTSAEDRAEARGLRFDCEVKHEGAEQPRRFAILIS